MSEARKEKSRECMRKLHDKRRAMGICIYCSGMIDDPQYSFCARCREKKREKNAKYREYLHKLHNMSEETAPNPPKEVPSNHKCWTCVWSRFEGDRFSCPFPEGICEKDEKKEVQEE